jgi:hypothetical protein
MSTSRTKKRTISSFSENPSATALSSFPNYHPNPSNSVTALPVDGTVTVASLRGNVRTLRVPDAAEGVSDHKNDLSLSSFLR